MVEKHSSDLSIQEVEREGEEPGARDSYQGHALSDLLPPDTPHLPVFTTQQSIQTINPSKGLSH